MENPLNAWFFSTGKIVTDSKIQNVTHFMLDGGKLDLSKDYDIFQELYAKYIKYKNCIVERKTDIFKFFIDFDVLSEVIIDIHEYALVIQQIISNIYKNNELICIITGADKNKTVIKNEKEYIKQGFHFHWKDIFVDKQTALIIRNNIIVTLTNVFGKKDEFYDNWEKIIDKCVYDKNGLRLIGSDKCAFSDGMKQYENRVYELKFVYTGNKQDSECYNKYSNTLCLIKDTSIRCFEHEVTKIQNIIEYIEQPVEETKSGNLITISRNSPEGEAILKFFKLHANGYKYEDIRTISKVTDKEMYLISTKSKWCQNNQNFHTNNHVYFKLTNGGLCQKCMSENSGLYGCCRQFESKCIPVTTSLQSVLNWKKPMCKQAVYSNDFTIGGLLQKLENNITGKDSFTGPGKKK